MDKMTIPDTINRGYFSTGILIRNLKHIKWLIGKKIPAITSILRLYVESTPFKYFMAYLISNHICFGHKSINEYQVLTKTLQSFTSESVAIIDSIKMMVLTFEMNRTTFDLPPGDGYEVTEEEYQESREFHDYFMSQVAVGHASLINTLAISYIGELNPEHKFYDKVMSDLK